MGSLATHPEEENSSWRHDRLTAYSLLLKGAWTNVDNDLGVADGGNFILGALILGADSLCAHRKNVPESAMESPTSG